MSRANQKLMVRENHGLVAVTSMSKAEAASHILSGLPHIHSASLGERDACVKATRSRLIGKTIEYPWVPKSPQLHFRIQESGEREAIVNSVVATLFSSERTSTKTTLKLILEELLSNAVYHSIRNARGRDQYLRTRAVRLSEHQAVELSCHRSDEGAYISVKDKGGMLKLTDIGRRLTRCYGSSGSHQMEKKESGAGLGFFMVFENVTHLEILVAPKLWTEIRVWLPLVGQASSNYFSFNYWGEKHVTK